MDCSMANEEIVREAWEVPGPLWDTACAAKSSQFLRQLGAVRGAAVSSVIV